MMCYDFRMPPPKKHPLAHAFGPKDPLLSKAGTPTEVVQRRGGMQVREFNAEDIERALGNIIDAIKKTTPETSNQEPRESEYRRHGV